MPEIPLFTDIRRFYKDGKLRDTARALLKELFLEYVHHESGSDCWWFTKGTTRPKIPEDYRVFWLNRKQVQAHRFAYELWIGDIPEGLYVLHSCDTPPCVNPDHLRAGSVQDNVDDKMERGRWKGNGWQDKTHCPQGHEYTEDNVYLYQNRRYCRACHHQYSLNHSRNMDKTVKAQKLRDWRAKQKTGA